MSTGTFNIEVVVYPRNAQKHQDLAVARRLETEALSALKEAVTCAGGRMTNRAAAADQVIDTFKEWAREPAISDYINRVCVEINAANKFANLRFVRTIIVRYS